MSGFLKGLAFFNIGYEFDFVKMAVGIAILDILIQLIKGRVHISYYLWCVFVAILLFYIWMTISSLYSPSRSYKYEKLLSFLGNIVFFIYSICIKRINFNLFINWYIVILIPLAIVLIYLRSITWTGDIESPELFIGNLFDYLSLGLHLGIAFLLLNYFNKNIWIQISVFALLVASSARAPLLITVCLTLIMNFNSIFKFKFITNIYNFKSMSFVALLMFFFSTQILQFFSNSYARLDSLFSSIDSSTMSRMDMFEYAFSQPFESFATLIIGNGIGSFGIYYTGRDERAYPHNIVLETFFELGIIGLVLGLIIIVAVLIKLDVKRNVFSVLLLFVFLNAMKSSNLTDLWILFSFIGASTIANAKIRSDNSIKLNGDGN